MDTSAEETVSTDSVGRRTGPRRQHTLEEKLRIVKETHVVGATGERGTSMLPVKVSTPTVLPTERARRNARETVVAERASSGIEIKLSNGHSIVVHGHMDAKALARVIDVLVRR